MNSHEPLLPFSLDATVRHYRQTVNPKDGPFRSLG